MLNEENIAWLEQVFRENVGKGKEEFTLDEFKKIVPSKNVSYFFSAFNIVCVPLSVAQSVTPSVIGVTLFLFGLKNPDQCYRQLQCVYNNFIVGC